MTTRRGRPDAALRDPEQRAHAELAHAVLVEHLDRERRIRPQRGGALGQCLGIKRVGRLGHQIAREGDRLRRRAERPVRVPRRVRSLGRHRDRGERGLLLGFLRRAVLVEAVGAQLPRRKRAGRRPRPASPWHHRRDRSRKSLRFRRRRSDARRDCRRDPATAAHRSRPACRDRRRRCGSATDLAGRSAAATRSSCRGSGAPRRPPGRSRRRSPRRAAAPPRSGPGLPTRRRQRRPIGAARISAKSIFIGQLRASKSRPARAIDALPSESMPVKQGAR